MRPVPSKPDHDVAYVTDVEGSWLRLASFCAGNPLVHLDSSAAGDRLRVQDGATFVFGGDAIDRGPWSRKIVRTLLEAKRAQPEQVVLLAGNRDLNKLRLARELEGHAPKRAPDEIRAAPRAQLLKWIFQHTMGAADAFEHRRTELVAEQRAAEDEDVAQSFVDDLLPTGELARYLDACQLTWRAGATLFVHGGVAEEALALVPGHDIVDLARFDDAVWSARLDAFYGQQLAAFHARAIEPDGTPAWQSAILYQAPRKGMKLNPGSVVYGRMGDELNNPGLPSRATIDALARCGIRRVVVGHTPSGDTPSVVRSTSSRQPFEVVVADNSRSRVDTGSRIVVRDAALHIDARCVLDDVVDALDVKLSLAIDDRHTPIGRRMADGSLIKSAHDGGWLVFRYDPGWLCIQKLVAELGPLDAAHAP